MKQLYKESLSDIAVHQELIYQTKLRLEQKRAGTFKRKKTLKFVSIAACIAVALFSVMVLTNCISLSALKNSFFPSTSSVSNSQEKLSVSNAAIHINTFGDMIEEAPILSGPAVNRVEQWTFQQYCDLLGFNPLPTAVLDGLNLVENSTKDISFQNDEREDFYNTWSFAYRNSSKEDAKCLTVNVNPSFIPYWSAPRAYQLSGDTQITDVDKLLKLGEKSEINGTEVTLWYKDQGNVWDYTGGDTAGDALAITDYYCADFEYKGAGFTVTAQNGITEKEFLQVLESIIK